MFYLVPLNVFFNFCRIALLPADKNDFMKKILIALDYYPTAEKIAEAGYALAKAMDAAVILVHVLEAPTYYSNLDYSPIMGYGGFNSAAAFIDQDSLERAAGEFLAQSKKHLGDGRITTSVLEGDCAEAILAAAKAHRADVIVLGTHSRRGLDRLLMGSVAEKVLHHCELPVLIIPSK